jgi:hypothetical protein
MNDPDPELFRIRNYSESGTLLRGKDGGTIALAYPLSETQTATSHLSPHCSYTHFSGAPVSSSLPYTTNQLISQSNELNRVLTKLVQHFCLQGEFTLAQERYMFYI